MSDDQTHRCRRGGRCSDHERLPDGSRLGSRINHEDGLCTSCEKQVVRAISELPRDYTELALLLGKAGSGAGDKVSGTRELPVPIRLSIEALMTRIVHESQCWAESVAEKMRIDWDTQHARDSRPGVVLDRACSLLAKAPSALLALQPTTHVVWGRDEDGDDTWEDEERDGVEGALLFLDLHHQARSYAGLTRLVERKTVPCPRCDAQALTHESGAELVVCGACGREYTLDEYDKLCTILGRLREAG